MGWGEAEDVECLGEDGEGLGVEVVCEVGEVLGERYGVSLLPLVFLS